MSDKSFHRSPNYPAFNLEMAIEKLQQIYNIERGFHLVAYDVLMKELGYAPKSSGGIRTVATLQSFGLLDATGTGDKRQFQVSTPGKTILLQKGNSPERVRAIKEAALKPEIHFKIRERFSGRSLPSDDTLHNYLVSPDVDFNPGAIKEFITELKETFEFANVGESSTIQEPVVGGTTTTEFSKGGQGMEQIQSNETQMLNLSTLVTNGKPVLLRVPVPMTAKDFTLLKQWIDQMAGGVSNDDANPKAGQGETEA